MILPVLIFFRTGNMIPYLDISGRLEIFLDIANMGGILVGGENRNPVNEQNEYKEKWVEMSRTK